MKTSSTFFFLTSNAGRFVSSGTILLVKRSENLMGFDTRNVETRNVLNASTYHEYNKLACHVFAEYKAWYTYDFVKN